jgi:hypothetical protein
LNTTIPRVNRPVRKRAAELHKKRICLPDGGRVGSPRAPVWGAEERLRVVRREDGAEGGPTRFAVSPLRARGQLAIESSYLPPPRSSCAVIYRPYLKPANCLFKHNKTAVPPFNLRGSPFRVRGPCRLPPKPPPDEAHPFFSLSLSCAIIRPPLGPYSRSFVDAIARLPLRTYAYGRPGRKIL